VKNRAFSLVEIMIVLAIIAILVAISMSVIVTSKKSAYRTRESSQLRQIYLGLNLYETDFDQQSPDSLVTLRRANYLPTQMLACPNDVRTSLSPADWPANPWVMNPLFGDPPELIEARYSEMNSYQYLKTYRGRFAKGRTYAELRNDSNMGLITGLGLMTCASTSDRPGCYYGNGNPSVDRTQPPLNLLGALLTVRTDGSITNRVRIAPSNGTMSYEQLFLFYPM
jgi:hypothetical protein